MATSTIFSARFSPILRGQTSDEFRLLGAAASKAEEAASRYEKHTAGLLRAKNSSQHDTAEISNSSANYHFPLNSPPAALNSPESRPARSRIDDIQDCFEADDRGTMSFTHQKSSSPTLERPSNAEACIEASKDDGLALSLNGDPPLDKKPSSLEAQKNPDVISSATMKKAQSPAIEASSLDSLRKTTSTTAEGDQTRTNVEYPPLTDKLVDQKRQHKVPKAVVEWMNGGKATVSEPNFARSKSEISGPISAKSALSTPWQMSNTRPTQFPTSNAVKTSTQQMKHSSVQNPSHSNTASPNTMSLHLADDLAFVQVFKDTIYEAIKASEKSYRGRLPEDILRTIGKIVAHQVVNQSLRNLVRACLYKLDNEQKEEIQKSIKSLYNEKAAGSIARIRLASGQKTSDQHPPKVVPHESKGLPRILSTRSSAQTSALPSSSSAQSSLSANSFVVRKDAIVSKSTENLGVGNITINSHPAPESPESIPGSVMASSDTAVTGKLRLSSIPSRHDLPDLLKQSLSPEARVLSAVDPGIVSTTTEYVDGRMKSSDQASESKLLPSSLESTTKCEREDGDQKRNQRIALAGNHESVEQKPDTNILGRESENVPNHSVNTTSAQPNFDKQYSTNAKLQFGYDKKVPAQLHLYDDLSSEEDADQVLASWLTAKPSKETFDQKMPNRSIEDFLIPRKSSEERFSGGTRSSPATSSYTAPPKAQSLQSSQIKDSPTIVPKSKPHSSPTQPSKFSRPTLLPEGLDSAVLHSDADSAPSKETTDCPTTVQPANSVRPLTRNPLQRSKGSSERQEVPSQRQEALPQRQKRTPPHPDRPIQNPSRPSRHSTRSFPSSTSTPAPVIVGRPLQQDDPDLVKTLAQLALHSPTQRRPYHSRKRARDYSHEQRSKMKHIDFSEEECREIMQAWLLLDSPHGARPKLGLGPHCRRELQESLQTASPAEMANLLHYLDEQPDKILHGRSSRAIKLFLGDLVEGRVPSHPKCIRVEVRLIDPCHRPLRTTASLLRQRELGTISGRAFRNVKTELQLRTSQKISPWRSWKGASGDIVTCAWAPSLESNTFAIGAAAHTNEEDLQYNRPRNLLLGNIIDNTLQELPDHRISRPRPHTISRGPNSNQAVYDACDPMVYTTVSSLQFSGDGRRLYSASHDKTVKIWDVPSSSCIKTLRHHALVSELDVSNYFQNVFAAATKTIANSIHVYFPESDDSSDPRLSSVQFESPRAKSGRRGTLFPGCLRWGKTMNTSRLLLAGFQQWGADYDSRAEEGELCLWDVQAGMSLKVSPSAQSVFAATWHPTLDLFAAGGSVGRNRPLTHPATTRSVVRTWDVRSLARYAAEYECPAIDMQDVTFNPYHPNIVTAGCTDSATYVWDFRKPDHYLHRLQHGRPLLDWDHTKSQEEGDPGVMMTLWGMEGALLYTGSSDGIVKSWDIMRAPEDVHVGDVGDLGAGVQSGAFSPDFSHLLVGDSDGGVHLLSSAPVEGWTDTGDEGRIQPIEFIQARDAPRTIADEDNPGIEGIEAAQELLSSGRVVFDPRFGVGQGPNYGGPYARHARVQAEEHLPLLPDFEALQPFGSRGQENLVVSRTRQNLMEERRRLIAESRGEKCVDDGCTVKDESDGEEGQSERPRPIHRKRDREDESRSPGRKRRKWAIVDLCTPPPGAVEGEDRSLFGSGSPRHGSPVGVADDDISESEMVEENYWWPRMDEEVFVRLQRR